MALIKVQSEDTLAGLRTTRSPAGRHVRGTAAPVKPIRADQTRGVDGRWNHGSAGRFGRVFTMRTSRGSLFVCSQRDDRAPDCGVRHAAVIFGSHNRQLSEPAGLRAHPVASGGRGKQCFLYHPSRILWPGTTAIRRKRRQPGRSPCMSRCAYETVILSVRPSQRISTTTHRWLGHLTTFSTRGSPRRRCASVSRLQARPPPAHGLPLVAQDSLRPAADSPHRTGARADRRGAS